ncbi:glycerophosphoryl diester phosphodiesterase membrane domain-containing protein [Streptomyces ficellus]|uniref:Glycerophosphoryl diester phosphodiesterase membrane domain-containing protein n=1 Tax=Streptomyces ficellus TaxID=1977088 RepID=A0ABT7Z6L3_9ACTN|nr:glycerophosphoryl diester phosphodiesterase membrane domain-containing protein [Streptomyces ficellus]MDN3295129.1 glycerophosphoryl diester phosphodiesterase membrane domain-containing protein [Streptomyces ficellus]
MTQHMGWEQPAPPPPGMYGWSPSPPPPKPGVIPLAPLSVGDIIGGAVATIGRYGKQLLGIAAAVYAVAALFFGGVLALAYVSFKDSVHGMLDRPGEDWSGEALSGDDWSRGVDWLMPLILAFVGVYLFGTLVLQIANAVVYASCPAVLQDAVLGRPTTMGTVWRRAWARVGSVIGSLLLLTLIAAVPTLLMVMSFIALFAWIMTLALDGPGGPGWLLLLAVLGLLATGPVAIWLWVRFTFAPAVAVFEGKGTFAALARSAELVRGSWWRIFGISLLAALIVGMANYLLQLPFSFVGPFVSGGSGDGEPNSETIAVIVTIAAFAVVAQMIGQIIAAVFSQLVTGLLYVDQRIRKENLAVSLAEAAAVTPTDPPVTPYTPQTP